MLGFWRVYDYSVLGPLGLDSEVRAKGLPSSLDP